MVQQLDEPRSIGHRNEREISPPVVGPGRIEPPTHPSVPRLRAGRLRFAPSLRDYTDRPANPLSPAHRMDRVERIFEAGWVGLITACAAECVYRLL